MKHAREDYNRIQDPAGLIPENEPVFLLRGQDEAAASTVRFWARLQKVNSRIYNMALRHAEAMDRWPKHKAADLPIPTPYCGFCGNTASLSKFSHICHDINDRKAEINICANCVARALRVG